MIRHVKQYEIQQSTYFEGGIGDDNHDMLPRVVVIVMVDYFTNSKWTRSSMMNGPPST